MFFEKSGKASKAYRKAAVISNIWKPEKRGSPAISCIWECGGPGTKSDLMRGYLNL
jgi:hypothetical protein